MNENQENLLDHYSAPRNWGLPKFKYSTKFKLQNLSCGDEIEVYIQVNNNILNVVSFTGEGCSIAIGTASQLYEMLIGYDINEIINIDVDYPEKLIGIPLTTTRKKCASLSLEAIKEAIKHYHKENTLN